MLTVGLGCRRNQADMYAYKLLNNFENIDILRSIQPNIKWRKVWMIEINTIYIR